MLLWDTLWMQVLQFCSSCVLILVNEYAMLCSSLFPLFSTLFCLTIWGYNHGLCLWINPLVAWLEWLVLVGAQDPQPLKEIKKTNNSKMVYAIDGLAGPHMTLQGVSPFFEQVFPSKPCFWATFGTSVTFLTSFQVVIPILWVGVLVNPQGIARCTFFFWIVRVPFDM